MSIVTTSHLSGAHEPRFRASPLSDPGAVASHCGRYAGKVVRWKMAARAFSSLRILALVGVVLSGKRHSIVTTAIRKGYPLKIVKQLGTIRSKMLISPDRRLSFDQAGFGHCRMAAIVFAQV